uniref:J domain-containing protein n=1 Tax=Tetradesmus obliquus TaxID=3088 RepID=A0A383VGM1_TETOB|eukprot:jgi/Sobl393_1/14848/SZX64657.1
MHCPLRTPPHSQCSRRYRGQLASRCQPALPHNRSRLLGVTQRRRTVGVQAAAKTLYEALGVSQDATDRDIKKAYRQKALKLHPDVNKAPNAQEQFLEVKNAFSVLSDAQQRAAYDRKLRGGFGDFGSWGSSAGGFGGAWGGSSSSSSAGGRPRPKQPEEEFYGLGDLLSEVGASVGGLVQQAQQGAQQLGDALKRGKIEDFFNDLEKEVNDWSKKRSASGKPASLWEELSAIGEEFVDFLEQGLKDEQQQTNSSSSKAKESWQGGGAGREGSSSFKGGGSGSSSYSSSSSSRARSPVDKFEELKRQYDLYDEGKKGGSSSSSGGSSSSSSKTSSNSSSSARTAQPPPRKTADEEIDDMLAALKKKMNK